MGPQRAAQLFAARQSGHAVRFEAHLYGSLAAAGKGHLTDEAVLVALGARGEVVWHEESLSRHPNGMRFAAIGEKDSVLDEWEVYSIGGGELQDRQGFVGEQSEELYTEKGMSEILTVCRKTRSTFAAFVKAQESPGLWNYLTQVWQAMREAVERGLAATATALPGGLQLTRRAARTLAISNERVGCLRDFNLLSAYALAVAEENAAGGIIVTAPTCGSAGVLPGVLYYFWKHHGMTEDEIVNALATAGLFGNVIVSRASISGAEVGCQSEVGTASAMAAAAQLWKASLEQIEYAAEMALEHSLGLTCDPVDGLVQVPCIERNAFAAKRAVDCAAYALATDGRHLVSFDDAADVMYQTGKDMQAKYRETARGGLAALMRSKLQKQTMAAS